MKIPAVHMTKLDDKSRPVVHFDREPGTKAYRLFDPIANSIHISRDVIFNEKEAWIWTPQNTHTTAKPEQFTIELLESDHSNTPPSPLEEFSASTPQSVTQTSLQDIPQTDAADTVISSVSSDGIDQPHRFRRLEDIYDHTTEMELAEELLLMGVDEPICFKQEVKEDIWK